MEDYEIVKEFETQKFKVEILAPVKNDREKLEITLEILEKIAKEKNRNL